MTGLPIGTFILAIIAAVIFASCVNTKKWGWAAYAGCVLFIVLFDGLVRVVRP